MLGHYTLGHTSVSDSLCNQKRTCTNKELSWIDLERKQRIMPDFVSNNHMLVHSRQRNRENNGERY